ncbi:MAG: hypothetical protein IIZ28_04310 [Erysipelotrichaceae bacterium]|nr:hypothetical protein [Erysipelotrichaceae bacterium]
MYNLEENLDVEFDYSPFFKSLEKKGISIAKFVENGDISTNHIHRMKNKMNMSFYTMAKIMRSAGIDDPHDFVQIKLVNSKTGRSENK